MVGQPVNDRIGAAADYQNYRFLKKLDCFDEYVAHELHKMAKMIAVQMKDTIFSGKYPKSVISFFQELKSAR